MTDAMTATRLWLVRLGGHGEFETLASEQSVLTIDFGITEDISYLKDREALISHLSAVYPNAKANTTKNFAAQVNQFINVAQVGDLVVSPMKTTSTISIGRITGAYQQGQGGRPQRTVEWLKTDLPRDTFKQDLLFSFGAFMTVCEVQRNNALDRVKAVIATGKDPGYGAAPGLSGTKATVSEAETGEAEDQPIDLAQIARDQIEQRIASSFAGHDLTYLVAAILRAQGYQTHMSPPGADNGIDIVAGSGALGLESPRVVVQVKSGAQTVDQPTLQGLIGSVQDTQADHGLIVSWNGYTKPVRNRVNDLYFRVRLWGREELVDNLLATYERLPEDIRAELPLKRTWTLVLEESEDLS